MKKLTQTRLHNPPESRGNCYPTAIACFMDLDSPEDAFQVQELYDTDVNWDKEFKEWINTKGWKLGFLEGHLNTDEYYLVSGETIRGTYHICIYLNGKLYHDPHPSQSGLVNERLFEYMRKLTN